MNNKHFSREEIVAVLRAAEREANKRLNCGVQGDAEHIGWRTALIHIAAEFGVAREYIDNPHARAEKIQ